MTSEAAGDPNTWNIPLLSPSLCHASQLGSSWIFLPSGQSGPSCSLKEKVVPGNISEYGLESLETLTEGENGGEGEENFQARALLSHRASGRPGGPTLAQSPCLVW
jgi:hypothetical protein